MPKWFRNAIIVLLCIAFVATRFWRLTDSCLWFDEIFSIHAASLEWNSLFQFIAQDIIHPPLFYVLLKLWIAIGGDGLAWVRAFPVFFACCSIIPVLSIPRVMERSSGTPIILLSFLVANGAILKYSQEVRMYSLLMCLSLFSIWIFTKYFTKGKNYVPLIIINVLMVWTHYFGWFVVVAEVAAILYFQRIKWRRILIMFSIVVASFVPWVIAVLQASGDGGGVAQNIGWMQRPGLRSLTTFVFNLVEPFYCQASSVEPISVYRVTLPIFAILTAAISIYFSGWNRKTDDERQHVKLFAFFAAIPLVLAFVVSWISPYSIWGTRHLIIVFVPAFILFAIILDGISIKWLRTTALTLLVLFGVYGAYTQFSSQSPKFSWCCWEPLTTSVDVPADATIYAFEDLVAYHVWFANRGTKRKVVRVVGMPNVTEDKAYFLPRGFDDIASVDASAIEQPNIFIVYRAKTYDESSSPIKTLIDNGYRIKAETIIDASNEQAILVHLKR